MISIQHCLDKFHSRSVVVEVVEEGVEVVVVLVVVVEEVILVVVVISVQWKDRQELF